MRLKNHEARHAAKSENKDIVSIVSIALLMGSSAVTAASLTNYYHQNKDTDEATSDFKSHLPNAQPCGSDPFKFENEGKQYVVSDSRCNYLKEGAIEVFKNPNDSTLGPIATMHLGAVAEAICAIPKQETADTSWIRITLSESEGVVYRTESTQGYVRDTDVIGDTTLPACRTERYLGEI